MAKLKCPECGKRHKHQMSAQKCKFDADYPRTHAIIARVVGKIEMPEDVRIRAEIMDEYFDSLPFPKHIQEMLNGQ